ncbi:MAG: HAD family hydrolase [Anaerolineales bacterium]|nr:HAD family hydrolase [Anaerolineales bacterium]
MKSPIRHILFDLGGTLMHSRGDWASVLQYADEALTQKLDECDIKLDKNIFRARLHKYYEQRDKDFQETTYHFVLRELLEEQGYAEVDETAIRSALDAMYSITQTNWILEEDTLAVIQNLKSENYQLGIFSNAGDDKDVQELIESFAIQQYFDFVLTSAACFYRKPHPRAFEMALARWSIAPSDAVMIGDSLQADIYGAKNLGMQTIWLTRRAQFNDDIMQRIQPDFSLQSLDQLLPMLEQINHMRA